MNKVLYVAAVGVAMVILAASSQAQPTPPRPAINYNASKSNTGNFTNSPAAFAAPISPCPDGASRDAAGACQAGKVNKTTTRSNTQHN